MAAGWSTRFGRAKQFEPVGPAGEWLMDYGIWDGQRAGFGRVVFVIRSEMESAVSAHMDRRWPGLEWRCVFQDRVSTGDANAPLRGTAHAVLIAAVEVTGRFAVMNADDFYGRAAFDAIARQLARLAAEGPMVVAGYRLGSTLSPHGGVSRAVLRIVRDGRVERVLETLDIRRTPAGITGHVGGDEVWLDDAALVSMNLWGFTPVIVERLGEGLAAFVAQASGSATEYALSTAVDDLLMADRIRLVVAPVPDEWMGLTHAADLAAVRARIAVYVADGVYPVGLAAGSSEPRS